MSSLARMRAVAHDVSAFRVPPHVVGAHVTLDIVGRGPCAGCGRMVPMRMRIGFRAVGRAESIGLCCAESLCGGDLLTDEDIARWHEAHEEGGA